MLEESLTNPKTSPADAALAILFFLRQELPLGGAAAEARFIRLFPLLMERIFGPLQPLDATSNTPQDSSEKDMILPFHHQGGGWLNRDRWLMRRSSSLVETTSTSTSLSQSDMDPIVELLSGLSIPINPAHGSSTVNTSKSSILLDVLEEFAKRKNTIHIGLPLGALPYLTQINVLSTLLALSANVRMDPKNMLDLSTYSAYTSSLNQTLIEFHRFNAQELFTRLLNIGPQDQIEILQGLRKWISSLAVLSSSTTSSSYPAPVHSLPTLLSPPPGGGGFSPPPTFMRPGTLQSPLAGMTPKPIIPSSTSTAHVVGGGMSRLSDTKPIQSLNVELNIFEYYILTFIRFPLASTPPGRLLPSKDDMKTKAQSLGSVATTNDLHRVNWKESYYPSYGSRQPYGEAVYYECFKSYLNRYMKYSSTAQENKPIDRKSELFLRLIIEFWLDRDFLMNASADCQSTTTSRLTERSTDRASGRLNPFFNTAMLSSKECPLPLPTPKGFGLGRFTPLPPCIQKCLYTFVQHILSDPCLPLIYCDPVVNAQPQYHSTVQPSLYNYIRVTLRYAPVHDTNSSFYSALKLWLLWMEPWNITHRKRPSANEFLHSVSDRVSAVGRSSHHHPSHMHTVMDTPKPSDPSKYSLSWARYVKENMHFYEVPLAIFLRRAREFDFSTREFDRSVDYLRKVFRVFSPVLLSCGLDLTAHQSDMQALLEEIVISHNRNLGEEDFADKVLKWTGLVDRKPNNLIENVIEQGKLIAGLPLNFEVIPSKKNDPSKDNDEHLTLSPERTSNTFLTETGRKQLAAGARQCTRNIYSLGDPMYFRPRSYEIPLLVQLTIKLSEKLNNYLGLSPNYSEDPNEVSARDKNASLGRMLKQRNDYRDVFFRFNLRFLADYRNCLFIGFVYFLVKVLFR